MIFGMMLFKLIKDWFDFSPNEKDRRRYTYKNYNGDLPLLSEKIIIFLREQFDEIQTRKIEPNTIDIFAKRKSFLRKVQGFSTIQVFLRHTSNDLDLRIILEKKPKHDLWTVTDPWQNSIREEKIDFRNFLIESVLSIVLSLKNSKKR